MACGPDNPLSFAFCDKRKDFNGTINKTVRNRTIVVLVRGKRFFIK
jgi:hypothetical protein